MASRPWKQNFRQVPPQSKGAFRNRHRPCDCGGRKEIPSADIARGIYQHLGMRLDGDTVVVNPSIVPAAEIGQYSGRNIHGWEIVLKDEPKITKTYSWETPNFGDAATYGTHTHYQSREVYQRKLFEARHLPIAIEVIKQPENSGGMALVKFAVDWTLDRSREDFDDYLLFCLNLLQENAGVIGLHRSDVTRESFLGTIRSIGRYFRPAQLKMS